MGTGPRRGTEFLLLLEIFGERILVGRRHGRGGGVAAPIGFERTAEFLLIFKTDSYPSLKSILLLNIYTYIKNN